VLRQTHVTRSCRREKLLGFQEHLYRCVGALPHCCSADVSATEAVFLGILLVLTVKIATRQFVPQRPSRVLRSVLVPNRDLARNFPPECGVLKITYVVSSVAMRIQRQLECVSRKAGSMVWQVTDSPPYPH